MLICDWLHLLLLQLFQLWAFLSATTVSPPPLCHMSSTRLHLLFRVLLLLVQKTFKQSSLQVPDQKLDKFKDKKAFIKQLHSKQEQIGFNSLEMTTRKLTSRLQHHNLFLEISSVLKTHRTRLQKFNVSCQLMVRFPVFGLTLIQRVPCVEFNFPFRNPHNSTTLWHCFHKTKSLQILTKYGLLEGIDWQKLFQIRQRPTYTPSGAKDEPLRTNGASKWFVNSRHRTATRRN